LSRAGFILHGDFIGDFINFENNTRWLRNPWVYSQHKKSTEPFTDEEYFLFNIKSDFKTYKITTNKINHFLNTVTDLEKRLEKHLKEKEIYDKERIYLRKGKTSEFF